MATLIGDPPNIMIVSAAGLSFNEFIMIMGPIAVIDMVILLVMFFIIYGRGLKVEKEDQEAIVKALSQLDARAAIQDISLFRKSLIVIVLVVIMFFLHGLSGSKPRRWP